MNRCAGRAFTLLFCVIVPLINLTADTVTFLNITNQSAGPRVRLDWSSEPGARHRVSISTNLSGGSWREVDLYESSSDSGSWLDPQTAANLQFYSVSDPQPEVFDMDPPVIDYFAGSSSYLYGQFIPSNAALQIITETIDGGFASILNSASPQMFNLVPETNGVWRVDFPQGTFAADKRILSAAIVDNNGTVLMPMKLDLQLSEYKRAGDAPADTPIAAPQPWHESSARHAIDRKGSVKKRTPAPGLPGEVAFHEVDLDMETPAGPPLRWVRTYRSKFPVFSGHGDSWDFNYNISVFSESADGTNSRTLLLQDGSGRQDRLYRGADGMYRTDGLFREGRFEGDVFVLTFADQGTWRFRPLTNNLETVKIDQMVDRFGVALTCEYDGEGKLASVHDQFGRSLHVNWVGGRIASVSNHVGHTVSYTYQFGMLAMATPPGSATSYRYEGYNLTNIIDGEGRVLEEFTYSGQTDPTSPDYDAIHTHSKSSGGTAVVEIITFGPVPAGIRAPGGYTMFLNDELGRLTEVVHDARHRPVRMRQYTGFCIPGESVSATNNRPANRLRAEDPEFFETTFAYNVDHALTRITHPDGSGFSMVYERDINPSANARERGNMRTASMIPEGGGPPVKVSFTYLPGFGAPESARPGNPIRGIIVKGGRNPGGDIVVGPSTRPGNPIKGIIIKGGKNPGGDIVVGQRARGRPGSVGTSGESSEPSSRPGNPIRGIMVGTPKPCGNSSCTVCKRDSARLIQPPKLEVIYGGAGNDAVTQRTGPVSGETQPNLGPAFDAASNPVPGIGIVVKHTPNCTGCKRCRNNAARTAYPSELSEGDHDSVELPAMLRNLLGYDTSHEGIGMPVSMARDGLLWRWQYNEKGALTRCDSPIPGSGLEAEYNDLGQCIWTRIVDGTNAYVSSINYGVDGFPSAISELHGLYSSTTQYAYNPLGRVTGVFDPNGQSSYYNYNDAGQITLFDSAPIAGSQIKQYMVYDAGGRLARMDVENRDEAGTLSSSNPYYSTLIQRDERGRIVRKLVEERPSDPNYLFQTSNYHVVEYTYDAAGQIVRVSTPAESLEQPQDEVCDFRYDERGFLHRVIAGGLGAQESVTRELSYDLYGNLTRHAIITGGVVAADDSYEYDGFQRTIKAKDAAGNISSWFFGERGWMTAELYGELNDVPGTNNNVLLYRSRSRGVGGALPGTVEPGGGPGKDRVFGDKGNDTVHGFYGGLGNDFLVGEKGNDLFASGFLLWPVEDDVIEIDRFMPGSTVASGTVTNFIDRSPAGLPLRELVNGDLIYAYAYDAFGELIRITNVAQRLDITKDPAGRFTAITRTDYASDGVTPPQSFTRTYDYDALGRITHITDGAGNQHTLSYDSLGRPVRYTDASGFFRRYDYDGGNGATSYSWRVIGDVNGDGNPDVLGSELARGGHTVRTQDASGYETSFIRDALGRLVRTDYPDGTHEMFAYDGRGFLSRYTKQDGTVIEYETSSLGEIYRSRPIEVPSAQTHASEQSYTYNGRGQLTGIQVVGGPSVSFLYDSWGNLIVDQQTYGSVTNSFNHRGRTGYTSNVDGLQVTEVRDALGRLTSISRNGAPVATLTYAGHRLHKSISANGTITTFEYAGDAAAGTPIQNPGFDQVSRIVVVSGMETNEESRIYDQNQRLKSVQSGFGNKTRNKSWTVDALGRVTGFIGLTSGGGIYSSAQRQYTLATDGTRLTDNNGAYIKSDIIPPGDAQMSQYTSWPNGPVEWTDNGELAMLSQPDGGSAYYLYDVYGRMVSATNTTQPSRDYDSDGDGRIIQTTGEEGVTRFIYNGDVCIQEIKVNSGTAIVSRVASYGAIFGIITAGTNYFVHGGMNEPSAFKYPILKGGSIRLRDVEMDDDISLKLSSRPASTISDDSGSLVERWDFDQDGAQTILPVGDSASATGDSVVGPLKWMAPEVMWLPDVRLLHTADGVYNPDLGKLCGKTSHF